MLNLCHRDGMDRPAPMVPGQGVALAFPLDLTGYRIAAGHHLRLALSNSYWPFVWPSPRDGGLVLTGGRLTLPLHQGADAAEWQPPPAEHARPWAHRVLRAGQTQRRIERDLLTGRRALVIEDDLGDHENMTHGLITGETLSERWEIDPDDPLSARALQRWEERLSRGGWSVRTLAEGEMTGSETHLRLAARLRAWDGETLVFERHWDEEVGRSFV